MDPAQAEHIARLLGQLHDGVVFMADAFTGNQQRTIATVAAAHRTQNPLGGVVVAFAGVAIIYAYDSVAKPLNMPPSLVDLIDINALGVTQNSIGNGETAEVACFRHLRNAFAHGRHTALVIPPATTRLHLTDERGGIATFGAECDAQIVVDLGERMLIEAHRTLVALAPPAAVAP
jgi:hypothetical protein